MAKAPPVKPEQDRPETDSTHLSSSPFPTPHPITTSQSSPWRFFLQQPGRGVLATMSRPAGPCEGQPAGREALELQTHLHIGESSRSQQIPEGILRPRRILGGGTIHSIQPLWSLRLRNIRLKLCTVCLIYRRVHNAN